VRCGAAGPADTAEPAESRMKKAVSAFALTAFH
jgi:hypothetical protein